MRKRRFASHVVAGSLPLLLVQAALKAVPAYNIYPVGPVTINGASVQVILAQGSQMISPNGTYVAATAVGSNYSYGILYNVPANTYQVGVESGVNYNGPTGTVTETYGVPESVNNAGIMFGASSGPPAPSINTLGPPTVWQNGVAYNLNGPRYYSPGPAFGSNNLNQSVGSVQLQGGSTYASVYNWAGPNGGTTNYGIALSVPGGYTTADGGALQIAYGINDSEVVVGTGNSSNAALASATIPFILNLGTGQKGATTIPASSSAYNSGIPFAISNSGYVTGSESFNGAGGNAFLYNMASGTTVELPSAFESGSQSGRGVNNSGEVVGRGGGLYAVPWLYDGTGSYDASELTVNNQGGAWHLSDNTSSTLSGIADNGVIVGQAVYNGSLTAFVMVPTGGTLTGPQVLTFNGQSPTWDTTSPSFNNSTGATTFSSNNSDAVTFTDNNNGNYIISIPVTVTPGTVTFNNSAGNYVINGPGGVGGNGRGNGVFTKMGTGSLTFNTVNPYFGPTNIYSGTVTYNLQGSLPTGTNLSIEGATAKVILSSVGAAYAQTVSSLSVYGLLDIANNDLIIHQSELPNVYKWLATGFNGGDWNGSTGIISSMAGASHPLMALGAILNDNGAGVPLYGTGGTLASTFGGSNSFDRDTLVKYTYYGDANLSGLVDGSDYTRIDGGYVADKAYLTTYPTGTAQPLTGWYNGDFNYDGFVNGSDYTLIDNAFNTEGAQITSLAVPNVIATTEIAPVTIGGATSAVPEPESLGIVAAGLLGLSRRRRLISRS